MVTRSTRLAPQGGEEPSTHAYRDGDEDGRKRELEGERQAFGQFTTD